MLQQLHFRLNGTFGDGNQLVNQHFLYLTTHLYEFTVNRRFDDGNGLLEFVLAETLLQPHANRCRSQSEGPLAHQRHCLIHLIFDIRLNFFSHRLPLVRGHAGRQGQTGLLHDLRGRLLSQCLCSLFNGRLLKLQRFSDSFLFSISRLSSCETGQRQPQQGNSNIFFHQSISFKKHHSDGQKRPTTPARLSA